LAAKAKAEKDSTDKFLKEADAIAGAALSDAKKTAVAQVAKGPVEALGVLAGNQAPVPIPETAVDIDFDGAEGKLEFNSTSNVKAVVAFYRSAMKPLGWKEQPSVINTANMVELDFSKGAKDISLTIMQMGNTVNVTANGSALVTAAVKPAAPDAASSSKVQSASAGAPVTEQDLEAEQSGGLPVPTRHTMTDGSESPFRREVTASVPADLPVVLAFYRRELGKLNWKEETKGAVIAADRAVVSFTSSDGQAVLTLGRKDGETSVNLAARNKDAATKAGMVPKPGQAKLLFGNMLPAETVITFNNQSIKVPAGAGSKGPDGPTLDVAPGKYKYAIKVPGKPAQNDVIDVGADETWGLLVGPGGALPLHMY
jgi:hypothetical protein